MRDPRRHGAAVRASTPPNADASPYRYSIEPPDLLRIVTEIEDGDDDIVAIYHSHTQSPAFPSRTDVERILARRGLVIVSLGTDAPTSGPTRSPAGASPGATS